MKICFAHLSLECFYCDVWLSLPASLVTLLFALSADNFFFHSTLSKGIDNILDTLEFWNPLLEKLCHIFSFYQKEYVKWTVTLMSTKSCRFSRIMSTKLSYIRDWLNIGKVAYLMLHLLQIVRILLNNTNNQSLSISFSLEIR